MLRCGLSGTAVAAAAAAASAAAAAVAVIMARRAMVRAVAIPGCGRIAPLRSPLAAPVAAPAAAAAAPVASTVFNALLALWEAEGGTGISKGVRADTVASWEASLPGDVLERLLFAGGSTATASCSLALL
eukprot:CAMPEP_0172800504 /NCGR_PEP_ID=MMETSP1075-20121228/2632_1 /TAXON_ID=2916 /ORGANISM="Ceratium fusus, Strain PA161109" /LENGTH=129 /DNA_ID=CAMNT_0013638431 /DNA_START=296 /DNA_END=686 /DNA_ORIENTATION=+